MVYRKVSSLFLSFFISLSMMLGVLSHNTFAAAGNYDSTVYLAVPRTTVKGGETFTIYNKVKVSSSLSD